jgi:polyvinyl alcohol dehydrogenase (cytochrome)
VLAQDNFMSGTVNGPLGTRGPDYDFGSSPQLIAMSGGKDILITGNKSSIVYAMDPATGKTVWATPKLGSGGASGGVEWGPATDGKSVYAPLADNPARGEPGPARGKPGLAALNVADGKLVWQVDAPRVATCNVPSGRCSPAYSGAATAIPGAVFTGAQDGHLRAYASDGKLIWDHDATGPFDTVNGIKGAPGGYLDMGGPTVAGGMVFFHSGYNGSAGANNVLVAMTIDGK